MLWWSFSKYHNRLLKGKKEQFSIYFKAAKQSQRLDWRRHSKAIRARCKIAFSLLMIKNIRSRLCDKKTRTCRLITAKIKITFKSCEEIHSFELLFPSPPFALHVSCCIVIKKRSALVTKPKQGGIIQMSVHTSSEAEVKCMAKKSSRLKCLAFNWGCSFVGDVTVHKPADMTCMTWIWNFFHFPRRQRRSSATRQCRPPSLSTFCFTIFGSLTWKNPNIKHLLMDLVVVFVAQHFCDVCSFFFADFILIALPNWDWIVAIDEWADFIRTGR